MSPGAHHKVTASHLTRRAFVYVRQSTVRQVFENTESTKRQYDLRHTATTLGWPADQIVVIDADLGQSGASRDREGFQRLVGEVGLGHAGIVLSLEVSRLARNSSDWHQLLEICAMTDTLIVDESGVYDPSLFNDRLLLGLKGTMSEAELHVMRARLRGGLLNKARRGELECQLPIGFVYDDHARVVIDPDQQVQRSVQLLFQTFARTGTAYATAAHFRKHGLRFPTRVHGGARHGEIEWRVLSAQRVGDMLHNPCYAGAFAYGRRQNRRMAIGRTSERSMPREQWLAFVLDAHPGYITWADHERCIARLRGTARAFRNDVQHRPPREGPALLQGLLLCGVCGAMMSVRYHHRRNTLVPSYGCWRSSQHPKGTACAAIPGAPLDAAIGDLLVESLTPMAVDIALAVEREIRTRVEQSDHVHVQRVERARYDADTARRRFVKVDPDNRLVAASLEADWNAALRALADAEHTLEIQRREQSEVRDPSERDRMLALTQDFPTLWRDPTLPSRERKRIIRLLIEDVTIHKDKDVTLHIRFRGGATTTREVLTAPSYWELRKTDAAVVAKVDALLAEHTSSEIAAILHNRGRVTKTGAPFHGRDINTIVACYRLATLGHRLRDAGMITARQLAARLGVQVDAIWEHQRSGRIDGRVYNDKGARMYDPETQPASAPPGRHTQARQTIATGSTQPSKVIGAV